MCGVGERWGCGGGGGATAVLIAWEQKREVGRGCRGVRGGLCIVSRGQGGGRMRQEGLTTPMLFKAPTPPIALQGSRRSPPPCPLRCSPPHALQVAHHPHALSGSRHSQTPRPFKAAGAHHPMLFKAPTTPMPFKARSPSPSCSRHPRRRPRCYGRAARSPAPGPAAAAAPAAGVESTGAGRKLGAAVGGEWQPGAAGQWGAAVAAAHKALWVLSKS